MQEYKKNRTQILLKKILFLLIGLGLNLNLFAQEVDIKKEFKELSLYYSQLEAFGVNIDVQYLNETGNVLMNYSGSVCRSKQLHFVEMGGVKSLMKDGFYVAVNESNKTVVYSEFDKELLKNQTNTTNVAAVLDSIWENQEDLKYSIISNSSNQLNVRIFDKSNTDFDAYDMMVDTKNHRLLRLSYYLLPNEDGNEVKQIRINYSNETSSPKLNQEHFKLKYYISSKKNQVHLTERFKDYRLIDQTKILAQYE